ncbi:hypothetical protein BGW41_006400 [Actinomortierella wolfii]|nr:hypothetical protein BGW41_006400 [Actinomortierella wolfii]
MNATKDGQNFSGETFAVLENPWTTMQIIYVSLGAILALMAFAEIFAFTGAVSYAFIKVHQKAKRWGERYLSLFIMLLWWLLRAVFLFGMLSLVPVPHYKNDALLPDTLRQASVYVAFCLVLILLIVPSVISIHQLMTAPSNMKERLESIRDTASFPRVLIVMPVYNELPEVLHVAICSVIDGEYPKEHVHIFISFDNDAVSELYLALIASLGVPPSDHYPPVIDLYYRGVQITVSRFPHGGKRLTQKKTFSLIGTIYKDYPEKTDHLFVLFIDSDILLHPATLGNFMWEMELKPGSRKDMLGMTGVITVTTKQNMSFIALLQDMEYVHGQFFGRAIESAVGGVICLPGALTMFRYSAFLKSSDEYFAEREAKDLWDFGRSHLGEDRYLTHLLMAGAKRPKMIQFCHRATCKTEPVMEWRNLLKQRRRWFLGFITNESSLLSDPLMWWKYPFLLGFRMLQNIVFGTSMIAYLIVIAVLTGVQALSWVWICLLGAYFVTNWFLMLTYGIWLGRRKAWLYPIMFIVGPFVSWFLLVYGVCTANERTWGGPRADASKAAEEGQNQQPIEVVPSVMEEHLKDPYDDNDDDDDSNTAQGNSGVECKSWYCGHFFDGLKDEDLSTLDGNMGNQGENVSNLPPQLPLHLAYFDDEQDNEDAKTFRTAHEEMDADNLSPRVSTDVNRGRLSSPEQTTSDNAKQEISSGNDDDDNDNRSEPKLGQPAARKRRDSTVSFESSFSSSSGASVSSSRSKSTTCESISSPDEDCLVIHPLGLSSTPRFDRDTKWWLDSEQLGSLGIVPFTQRPKIPEAFASVETLILSPVHMTTESKVANVPVRPKLEHSKSTPAVPTTARRRSMHEAEGTISRDHTPRNSTSSGNLKSRITSFTSPNSVPLPKLRDTYGPSSSRSTPSTPRIGAGVPAYSIPSASQSFASLEMPLPVWDGLNGSGNNSSRSSINYGGNGSRSSSDWPTTPRQRRKSLVQSPLSARGSPAVTASPVFQYIPSAYITPTHSAPASPLLPPMPPPSIPDSPLFFPITPSTASPNRTPTPDCHDSSISDSPAIGPSGRSGRSRVATAPANISSGSRSRSRSRTALAMMADHGAGVGSSSPSLVGVSNSSDSDSSRKPNKRLSRNQAATATASASASAPSEVALDRHSRSGSMASASSCSAIVYQSQENRLTPPSSSSSSSSSSMTNGGGSGSGSSSSSNSLSNRRSSSSSRPRRPSLDSSNIVTTAVSFTKDGVVPPVPPLPRVLPKQTMVPSDILRDSNDNRSSIESATLLRIAMPPRSSSCTLEGKSKWSSAEEVGTPVPSASKAILFSSSAPSSTKAESPSSSAEPAIEIISSVTTPNA